MTKEKEVGGAKKIPLFEKFYNIKEDALAMLEKPIVLRSAKRKFEASVDSCKDVIIKQEQAMNESCKDMKNLDVNKLLEINCEIDSAKDTIAKIKEIYLAFFGEEMKAD